MNSLASYGQGTFGDVMVRVGLIAYLMIATLAGPAWCCCTLDRLTLPSVASGESAKSSPAPTCCQHRAKPESKKSSNPTNNQDSKTPGNPCPCKEQGSNQAPATSLDVQTVKQLWSSSQALERDLVAVSSALIEIGSQVPFVCCSSSSTFHLSGTELLCALQVYRC